MVPAVVLLADLQGPPLPSSSAVQRFGWGGAGRVGAAVIVPQEKGSNPGGPVSFRKGELHSGRLVGYVLFFEELATNLEERLVSPPGQATANINELWPHGSTWFVAQPARNLLA